MNYKKIPVPEPDKNDLEYVCPSASWGDMTGLIPAGSENHSELLSYEEMYPFLPHPEAYTKD
ncbi:MAG: hypothetical protein IJ010_08645 [Ruminococcus sp.]|nr:hypothetical protein [Ruminococcus sp.]